MPEPPAVDAHVSTSEAAPNNDNVLKPFLSPDRPQSHPVKPFPRLTAIPIPALRSHQTPEFSPPRLPVSCRVPLRRSEGSVSSPVALSGTSLVPSDKSTALTEFIDAAERRRDAYRVPNQSSFEVGPLRKAKPPNVGATRSWDEVSLERWRYSSVGPYEDVDHSPPPAHLTLNDQVTEPKYIDLAALALETLGGHNLTSAPPRDQYSSLPQRAVLAAPVPRKPLDAAINAFFEPRHAPLPSSVTMPFPHRTKPPAPAVQKEHGGSNYDRSFEPHVAPSKCAYLLHFDVWVLGG